MPRPIQSEPIGKPPRRVQPKGREVIINDSDDLLRCDVGDPVDCNEMLQIPDPILMTSSGRRYRRYRRYRRRFGSLCLSSASRPSSMASNISDTARKRNGDSPDVAGVDSMSQCSVMPQRGGSATCDISLEVETVRNSVESQVALPSHGRDPAREVHFHTIDEIPDLTTPCFLPSTSSFDLYRAGHPKPWRNK